MCPSGSLLLNLLAISGRVRRMEWMSAAQLPELAKWRTIVAPDAGRYNPRAAIRQPLRHVCVSGSSAAKRFLGQLGSIGVKRRYAFRFTEVIFFLRHSINCFGKKRVTSPLPVRSRPTTSNGLKVNGSLASEPNQATDPRGLKRAAAGESCADRAFLRRSLDGQPLESGPRSRDLTISPRFRGVSPTN